MRGKLSEDPAEELAEDSEEVKGQTVQDEEEEDEEEEQGEEETLLKEFDRRRKQRQSEDADAPAVISLVDDDDDEEEEVMLSESPGQADTIADDSVPLEESLQRIRTLQDVELLSVADPDPAAVEPQQPPAAPPTAAQPQAKSRKRKKGIELKEVLTKKTLAIGVPLALTVADSEEPRDGPDQRGLIKEAFAGDDVVSDFLKEKRRQEDVGRAKDVDLTLPGWGDWGGTGIKPSRGKRRRFLIRAPPAPPRKDRGLPDVIISDKRSSSLSLHQVNSLPFPFQTHTQFESTLRSPLGRTWNTERAVKTLTKPRLVTHLGAIIEPMDEEQLVTEGKQEAGTSRSDSRRGRPGRGRSKPHSKV